VRTIFVLLAVLAATPVLLVTSSPAWADAPVANAGKPYFGVEGEPLRFNAAGSAGEGLRFQWDFGDGAFGEGVSPAHAYGGLGIYRVTLTVTDAQGQVARALTAAVVWGTEVVCGLTCTVTLVPPPVRDLGIPGLDVEDCMKPELFPLCRLLGPPFGVFLER
jgi:PKD domain